MDHILRYGSSRLALALTTISLAGCATTLPAPPIQTAPHDAPGTVGRGRTEVTGGGGFVSAIFDGSYPYGQVSVRHGVDDRTDVNVRATAGRLTNTGGEGRNVDAWRGLVALRLGLSRDIVPGILMGFVGLGGGASGAGGYLGLDYGLSLGYDNRYFIPFGAVSMSLSAPVTRPTLDFTAEDDTEPNLRRAYPTFGFSYALGARVPFGGYRSNTPHTGALTVALEAGSLYGDDPHPMSEGLEGIGYFGFYVGLSQRFGASAEN